MEGEMIKTSKYIIVSIGFIFIWLGFISASADDSSKIIKGIQKKYGHMPGLRVNYEREVITQSMRMLGNQIKGESAVGQIFFKPPYFIRLEQKTPDPETLMSNGNLIWWYIPEKEIAYEYAFKDFGKELILLSDIFRGLIRVEENFLVAMRGRNDKGESLIELTPNPPWQEIDRIVLEVTPEYDISVVNIHNYLGTVTRFTLNGLEKKENLEERFFQFIPPDGVRILKEKRESIS
jgi:outer membrane lipoprotein-sorting protein